MDLSTSRSLVNMRIVRKKTAKNIVVIGGGTGVFTVLNGLVGKGLKLSAVITVADDGGSTGVLREDFGILPPGDIRRALIALSRSDKKLLASLFAYRFEKGRGLQGHSFGNLMLTALESITGSFENAIDAAGRFLEIEGQVIPVSLGNTRLYAELQNGQKISGETNIDIPKHSGEISIKRVWLQPQIKMNPRAASAIEDADIVILGPGGLYYSLIPNLLVCGVTNALKKSKAKKIFICNIATKHGETNNFTAKKFLDVIQVYLNGAALDYFIVNSQRPSANLLKRYAEEHSIPVPFNAEDFKHIQKPRVITAPLLRSSDLMRHDSQKLAKVITMLL